MKLLCLLGFHKPTWRHAGRDTGTRWLHIRICTRCHQPISRN